MKNSKIVFSICLIVIIMSLSNSVAVQATEVLPTQTCRAHIASGSSETVGHELVDPEYPAASGEFPVMPGQTVIRYDVVVSTTPLDSGVTIDGISFVRNGVMMRTEFPTTSTIAENQLGSLQAFFGDWSFCINNLSLPAVTELFTTFGWNWLRSGVDRFQIQDSAACVLAGGSLSRSVGALPLELFGLRELADGRVVVVTSDGSKHNDAARGVGNEGEGTLWILRPNADSWLIDGIVGDFKAIAKEWVVLPVE